jgi:hypothetical protein
MKSLEALSIKRIRKEKKNQKKKSSPLLSATILNVNYSLEDHMSYNIVSYEKIEHDKFMGGSFFFQVQVSRHLIFYA